MNEGDTEGPESREEESEWTTVLSHQQAVFDACRAQSAQQSEDERVICRIDAHPELLLAARCVERAVIRRSAAFELLEAVVSEVESSTQSLFQAAALLYPLESEVAYDAIRQRLVRPSDEEAGGQELASEQLNALLEIALDLVASDAGRLEAAAEGRYQPRWRASLRAIDESWLAFPSDLAAALLDDLDRRRALLEEMLSDSTKCRLIVIAETEPMSLQCVAKVVLKLEEMDRIAHHARPVTTWSSAEKGVC